MFSVYTRQYAKGKGVPVDNRFYSFRPSSELQIEGRRRKVQQAREIDRLAGVAVRRAIGQGMTSVLPAKVAPKAMAVPMAKKG